jgi:hypothetical protein
MFVPTEREEMTRFGFRLFSCRIVGRYGERRAIRISKARPIGKGAFESSLVSRLHTGGPYRITAI